MEKGLAGPEFEHEQEIMTKQLRFHTAVHTKYLVFDDDG